jgi:ATP-dependent RNA helicase DHX37/DHR1
MHLAKRLRQTFVSTQGHELNAGKVVISPAETSLETEDIELDTQFGSEDYKDNDGSDSEADIVGLDDDEEDDREFDIGEEPVEEAVMKVHVLPLYSQVGCFPHKATRDRHLRIR